MKTTDFEQEKQINKDYDLLTASFVPEGLYDPISIQLSDLIKKINLKSHELRDFMVKYEKSRKLMEDIQRLKKNAIQLIKGKNQDKLF